MTSRVVWIAEWSSEWGESHGTLGVFSSEDKAWAALKKHTPVCYASAKSKSPERGQGVNVHRVIVDTPLDTKEDV